MRAQTCAVVVLLLVLMLGASRAALSQAAPSQAAPAATCAKADFEAVVNAAGAALRDLAQQNTPVFQAKLRQLKDKRSWSNDEFLEHAEPLVRDEKIAGYDKTSEELVARITGGGPQSETPAAGPDCALLTGLQADLKLLVETQQAKWTHMLAKVDRELAR
jgi:hypothetical protein